MYEMGEQLERVVLAGVQTYDSEDTAESLLELEELTRTAGAVTGKRDAESGIGASRHISGQREAGGAEGDDL